MNMRKIINRRQAFNCIVTLIAMILVLSLYPCRVFKENIQTCGTESPAGVLEVGGDAVILQQFYAEYDRIASIGFMYNAAEPVSYTLRVFKEKTGEMVREITPDEQLSAGERIYAETYVNLIGEVGETYFYTVEVPEGHIEVLYEMTANSGASNNGYMQYAGENKDAYNVISRYTYRQPLRKTSSLATIAMILICAAALIAFANIVLIKSPSAKAWMDGLTTPRNVAKIILNPVVCALGMISVIAIGPLHMFSIFIADMVVMILGTLICVAVALYILNRREDTVADDKPPKLQGIAQSVCIALALWSCVYYMNALYEVFHDIAWRRMAFFLGLAIIVTWSKREMLNWYNLVLLAAGIVTARVYYVKNLPDMVDEYHTTAMFWTCMCIIIIFLMAGYVISVCVRRILLMAGRERFDLKTFAPAGGRALLLFRLGYIVVTAVLVCLMITHRFTRQWPVMMTVIGCVYIFRLITWRDRTDFTDNLTRGILLHFGACVVYCMLYRPYEAYEYVRFPLVFHTVTITAEYMAMVMCAAFVRLFEAYRRKVRIKACVWEMMVFGCVTVYTLFTMSRTAMTGIVACGLVMWLAYGLPGRGAKKSAEGDHEPPAGKRLLTMALMVACSTIVCFPPVFAAQKAIPGLVGEPRLLEIERYPQPLLISKDLESENYITVTRFSKAFIHKMLGLDEDLIKWDMYTIHGYRPEAYYTPRQVEEMSREKEGSGQGKQISAGPALYTRSETEYRGDGILLSPGLNVVYMSSSDSEGDFVPPREYSEEGEPPEEWYDEDYWEYRSSTGEWEFAVWKMEEEAAKDVTNGRLDIFRSYIEQLNDEGHEEMGAILDDGSAATHAHNIYLQVAYDHGKITGIVFIIWCIYSSIFALYVFFRTGRKIRAAGILSAVAVTYTVCGITEWISHPCNPMGMVMMLVCCALFVWPVPDKTEV